MPEAKPATSPKKNPPSKAKPAGSRAPQNASGKASAPPPVYPHRSWLDDVRAFLRRYGRSLAAASFILIGVVMLFGLRAESLSWAEQLFGWTTSLMAAGLILLGAVLLLGEHAGYWSAEALVGAELLLLSLQASTYIVEAASTGDAEAIHGGGMVGWALGSVLAQALGPVLALLLLIVMGLLGIVGLIRYTPLIYPTMALMRGVPALSRRVARWLPERDVSTPAVATGATAPANFVSPVAPARATPPQSTAAAVAVAPQLPDAATVAGAGALVAPGPGDLSASQPAAPERVPRTTSRKRPEDVTTARVDVRAQSLPPRELLASDAGVYTGADVSRIEDLIEQTLEDLDVPVRVVHRESGPTVTQFGVEPLFVERGGQKRKVRVSRIVSLADDLALALAAPAVRIEAPVPGRPYVGIEVPNGEKTLVSLRGIMESAEMHKEGLALALPLGRNTSGTPVVLDLTRAPHMLIAGATGSGKSVCINTIITGLLMRHSPQTLRFVMVDPKRVELTGYNGIPHLLGGVISEVDRVMPALLWLLIQMDDRYRLFREAGVRNIDAYNAMAAQRQKEDTPVQPLPYIVLIVDELADLMMTAPEDIERQLCRLAQMARATGIHLILATQRPSVDVVTGLIKANFPTRIAFAVTSQMDSRVILDGPGAERLLGRGDMLLSRPDLAKLLRVQGCLVTDDEIARVTSFWRGQELAEFAAESEPWAGLSAGAEEGDELVQSAIDVLQGLSTCSVSLLQRKLRIGFPRAARLMDDLESRGVVGPDMGPGQGREVLLPVDAGARDERAGREYTIDN